VPTLIGGHFRVDALVMAETRLGPAQYLKVHPPESDLFELLLSVPPWLSQTAQPVEFGLLPVRVDFVPRSHSMMHNPRSKCSGNSSSFPRIQSFAWRRSRVVTVGRARKLRKSFDPPDIRSLRSELTIPMPNPRKSVFSCLLTLNVSHRRGDLLFQALLVG
jgi:hypothetical protein